MHSKSWIILLAGFGTLVGLIGFLGIGAIERSKKIYRETLAAHDSYLRTEAAMRELPADLYLSGILVRDYLLDPSHLTGPWYRQQLIAQQAEIQERLHVLRRNRPQYLESLAELEKEVTVYWSSLDPVFDWTPSQKTLLSRMFLRDVVLPKREAVIRLANKVEEINKASLTAEQRRLEASEELFRGFVQRFLGYTLLIGLVVSAISISRLLTLEKRSEAERARAENAEAEMRQLSRRLVEAQEVERKSLSRELHDALGQKLSFIGMELSMLTGLRSAPEKFDKRLDGIQQQVTETVRAVRDLSMALRPAMLDELGLGSAVRWLGREFERRSGITVDVQVDGNLDELPEVHRTGIYRVIQEALSNCARHAKARHVRVTLYGNHERVRLTVQDDGVGFDLAELASRGLGLVGIQERIRDLHGRVEVSSTPGKGTIVEAEVPTGTPAPVTG